MLTEPFLGRPEAGCPRCVSPRAGSSRRRVSASGDRPYRVLVAHGLEAYSLEELVAARRALVGALPGSDVRGWVREAVAAREDREALSALLEVDLRAVVDRLAASLDEAGPAVRARSGSGLVLDALDVLALTHAIAAHRDPTLARAVRGGRDRWAIRFLVGTAALVALGWMDEPWIEAALVLVAGLAWLPPFARRIARRL